MNFLETFVITYAIGWIATAFYFGHAIFLSLDDSDSFRSKPEYIATAQKHPILIPLLTTCTLCAIALAAGSVWWIILLGKIGISIWHRLGHPGSST